jgi:hypothetical protein
MGGHYRKYTRELLDEAVAASTSVNGVLRHLGLNQAGGTHAHISRTIKAFELDTSHFVRFQNGAHRVRLTADQILVRIPRGSRRAKPHLLRRALDEIGRPHTCAGCGQGDQWQGRPLRLEIDHVDEDFHNNLAENLRYLCPNCHSQTANFAGRSKNKYAHVLPGHIGPRGPGDA